MEENTQENKEGITNGGLIGGAQSQIAGAIIVAGLIIAGAIMLKDSNGSAPRSVNTNTGTELTLTARPVSGEDHLIGNPRAKIVILEYSDLDCPFCKNFHATMKQVLSNNSDVAWVYRHYPIPQLHPNATKKAEATECAWEQGGNDAFWAYTDKLFEASYSVTELSTLAGNLGLNVNEFNNCLSSGKYASKVQQDVEDGQKMGVSGTPSSFILLNGKVADTINGAQKYETVDAKLKALK